LRVRTNELMREWIRLNYSFSYSYFFLKIELFLIVGARALIPVHDSMLAFLVAHRNSSEALKLKLVEQLER
jgi:hypothetical protein